MKKLETLSNNEFDEKTELKDTIDDLREQLYLSEVLNILNWFDKFYFSNLPSLKLSVKDISEELKAYQNKITDNKHVQTIDTIELREMCNKLIQTDLNQKRNIFVQTLKVVSTTSFTQTDNLIIEVKEKPNISEIYNNESLMPMDLSPLKDFDINQNFFLDTHNDNVPKFEIKKNMDTCFPKNNSKNFQDPEDNIYHNKNLLYHKKGGSDLNSIFKENFQKYLSKIPQNSSKKGSIINFWLFLPQTLLKNTVLLYQILDSNTFF